MTCVGTPFDGASVGAKVDMQYYPSNQPGGGMPAVSWPLLPTPIAGPPVGLFSYTTSLLITSTSDPKLVQTVQNVSAWLETNVESKCAVLKDPAVAIASEVLIDVTAAKAFFIPVTGPILSAAILVVGNAILVTCQVSGKLTLSGNAVNKILDYMSKITETGNLTVSGRYQGFGTGNQAITLDSSNTMNGQGPPFTLDFPAGACTTVQFGTFAMSVGGTVEVPVTRTGPSSALHVPASVLVDPIQDSQSAATPGVDYTFAPSCGGGVCFNPGDITANLVIQILPNPDRKTSKNLTLQLSLPADQDAVRLGQPAQTTLVIGPIPPLVVDGTWNAFAVQENPLKPLPASPALCEGTPDCGIYTSARWSISGSTAQASYIGYREGDGSAITGSLSGASCTQSGNSFSCVNVTSGARAGSMIAFYFTFDGGRWIGSDGPGGFLYAK